MVAPKVSIVIPVYNGADYLAQAINSALAQTWKNLEVIVVNDGSNDNGATEKIAKSYGDQIRYISKENGGVGSALNAGIRSMKGEYFSWLSHDDIYFPNKIMHQMKLIKRLKNPYQIVAGGYYIVNSDLQVLGRMDFNRLYSREELRRPLYPVFHCAVNGCTMLIHKSHFARVGVFREDLLTTQDYDLWYRILRGQKLVYVPSIDTITRIHPGQTSCMREKEHNEECEALWYRLIEGLSQDDKVAIAGSEWNFYATLFQHFSQRTCYDKVAGWLHSQCLPGTKIEPFKQQQPLPANRIDRWRIQWYQQKQKKKEKLS